VPEKGRGEKKKRVTAGGKGKKKKKKKKRLPCCQVKRVRHFREEKRVAMVSRGRKSYLGRGEKKKKGGPHGVPPTP